MGSTYFPVFRCTSIDATHRQAPSWTAGLSQGCGAHCDGNDVEPIGRGESDGTYDRSGRLVVFRQIGASRVAELTSS